MGSHAGEHFLPLSERFVIVRKHFVSVTAIQKNQVGASEQPCSGWDDWRGGGWGGCWVSQIRNFRNAECRWPFRV